MIFNEPEISFIAEINSVSVYMKREDQIHSEVSGNKFRKLKYNIEAFKSSNCETILTFGGAFSNHISATAAAGKINKVKTIGIIRGNELNAESNDTLRFASANQMKLIFVNREDYKLKENSEKVKQLIKEHNCFLVPEGGTNPLAIKGCEEILNDATKEFDYVCTSVGTGGTISGIINSSLNHQKILGFSVLKGDFLSQDISRFVNKTNWLLNTDYHFGGYAKISAELISFINQFKKDYNISLDPIYTGKMMFGVIDLINKGYFKSGSKILAIHTGGLQGIKGMNTHLEQKKLPLII